MESNLIVGRYELRRRLAVGGMATVHLALDQRLEREVAVKILAHEYAADPKFVERFKREAQATAALSHPNIVAVFDWGPVDDTYFIAMEYVPGPTLSQVVRERGPLPEREALSVAAQVAAALDYAHRSGVIHRDVKPQNVLLDAQGQAKVADFGLARAAGAAALTQSASIWGTAHYIAPEQIQQQQPVDARSDVYSLGVVLYEMLAGRPPFAGDSIVALAFQHVHEQPAPPHSLNRGVSPAASGVAMKALAKDPSERFQSAAEMREALVSTLDHPRRQGWTAALTRPVATPRATETRRPAAAHTRRLIPRPGMGALSILALILVAFGVVAALSSLLNGPGRPPDEAQGVSATSTSGSPNAQPTQAESNQPVVAAAPTTAPEPRPTPRPADSPPPSAAQSGPATAAPAPPTQTPQSTAAQRAAPPAQAASAQAAPAAPPAPAAQPLAAAGPTQAVSRFYNAIAQQDFDRAAALWSPRMRSAYPPRENIVTRFADTRQLVVQRTDLISADESAGVATVAVDLLEVTSAGNRRWVGNWHLVRGSSGWLLDQPDLRAA